MVMCSCSRHAGGGRGADLSGSVAVAGEQPVPAESGRAAHAGLAGSGAAVRADAAG